MGELLFDSKEIQGLVDRLSDAILEEIEEIEQVALIGIHTEGIPLARRLQKKIESHRGVQVPLGTLDINLYRDDYDLGDRQPEVRQSNIPFSVEHKLILLVDDVLFTGRTIRAALEAINDYGRPAAVRLAVLIDRGHRELPIEPNYLGAKVDTTRLVHLKVTFSEDTSNDRVERIDLPESKVGPTING